MHATRGSIRRKAATLGLVLGCASLTGCAVLGYERVWFASADVTVIHSERQCNDASAPVEAVTTHADQVFSRVDGIGRLAAARTGWEVRGRQLATELKTTFASHYSHEVSLAGALQNQAISEYGKRATGAKYLITPNK